MAQKEVHHGWSQRTPRLGRIRQLSNKGRRYQANYVWPPNTSHRHNAPTTFSTRALAERWLAGERSLIERGEWSPPRTRLHREVARAETFSHYAQRWIEERPLKQSSRREYRRMFDSFMADTLGPLPLHELTAAVVRTWYAELDTTPARK